MDTPIKILDYKTYNSIGHLSKSRLGAGDRHIDTKQEEILTEKFPEHQKCFLYIEEKMDGTNVCVVRHEGKLIVLGRNGYKCETSNQEQHKMFYRWVQENIDKFEKLLPNENDRIVGEWMALAHGTIYKHLKSPFMAFDLYYNKVQQSTMKKRIELAKVGLECVPLLMCAAEAISIENALKFCSDNGEGVIYRLEKINKKTNESTQYIPWLIAKLVKQDKEDGKFLKEGQELIWNWTEVEA